MAFCSSCGAEVEGKFCAKCGGAVGAVPVQPLAPIVAEAGMAENVASALCYILGVVTGILFLVVAPYNQNKTIRFHAWQSIFLWVACVAVGFAMSIFMAIFIHIPFLGVMLSLALWPLFGLGLFIVWIVLMYKAYNNSRWVLPVIGPLAEKQA